MTAETDVLIVGGGLAGLSLAHKLTAQGADFTLVEARSRFGGRIKTARNYGAYFDLGPAWFWPSQPRMMTLTSQLGLKLFEQFSSGLLTYEDQSGQVQHGRGYASMEASLRLEGGLLSMIEALEAAIPPHSLSRNTSVQKIASCPEGLTVSVVKDSRETTIHARQVVLGLPPRLAAESLSFDPPLPAASIQVMEALPTWMAGQAKAVAVYDRPFWREMGLSGDAMSQVGPMVEIHDASPHDASCGALFGFIGVPAGARADAKILADGAVAQFVRLFGEKAAQPRELMIKDWAFDQRTATPLDHAPAYAHLHGGLPTPMSGLMEGRLHFGSAEVASQFGGYLEGALEASESVLEVLTRQVQPDRAPASAHK